MKVKLNQLIIINLYRKNMKKIIKREVQRLKHPKKILKVIHLFKIRKQKKVFIKIKWPIQTNKSRNFKSARYQF